MFSRWNVKIATGPSLSVDISWCKCVGDVKTRVSSLFPDLGVEKMMFVAHGGCLCDSDEVNSLGVRAKDIVIVHWPAYIRRFHGCGRTYRASGEDAIEEVAT